MPLTTLKAELQGQPLHLRHPTEGTPLYRDTPAGVEFSDLPDDEKQKLAVVIRLLGKDSEAYKAAQRRSQTAWRERLQEGAKWLPADDEQMADQMLIDCTVGWANIPAGFVDGSNNEEPIDFSKERARALYRRSEYGWVREQVDRFIGNRANFVKASPES